MNAGQILLRAMNFVQVPVTDAYKTRAFNVLNDCFRKLWDMGEWDNTVEEADITIAASATSFVLPKRYRYIIKAKIGDDFLRVVPLSDIADAEDYPPDADFYLAPYGTSGVETQLSAADTVKVVSTSASDAAVSVMVRGLSAAGDVIEEVIATNGVTAVAGALTFASIEKLSKGLVNTAGIISLTNSAGSTTLATLAPYESEATYQRYKVQTTDTASRTVSCVLKRRFRPFTSYASAPDFECSNALIYMTASDLFAEMRNVEMSLGWQQRAQAEIAEMKKAQADYIENSYWKVTARG